MNRPHATTTRPIADVGGASTVVLATLATLAGIVGIFYAPHGPRNHVDVEVYRAGAQHILHNLPLYNTPYHLSDGSTLPFTYPPLAALLFTPLALLPTPAAAASIIFVSLACLIVLECGVVLPHNRTWLLITPLAILTGPIWATLGYGQINLILAALVMVDLVLPHKRRGLLTGTAAAIKLTPLAFGLWFLVRRDWTGFGRMLGAAAGWTVLAAVVLPHDSAQYWGSTLRNTGRIGDPYYPANQSLKGMLGRLGIDSPTIWLILSICSIIIVAILMRQLLAAGANLEAVCINGILALLISPISWAHHWIWGPVLILAVVLRSAYYPTAVRRVCRSFATLGLCCFFLEPQAYAPSSNHWSAAWNVFGNPYLWWGVASIGLGFVYARYYRTHHQPPHTASSRLSGNKEGIL